MRRPQILREGTKKTVFVNFMDLCKMDQCTYFSVFSKLCDVGNCLWTNTNLQRRWAQGNYYTWLQIVPQTLVHIALGHSIRHHTTINTLLKVNQLYILSPY